MSQAQLPQTPAGKAVAAYFKAFNAGEEAMKDFLEKFSAKDALQRMPIAVRLDRYRQMRGQIGTIELQKVVESRPNVVSVTARAQGGRLLRLDFEFEASDL